MTTPRVILIGLILGTLLCWFMASRAHAAVYPVPANHACAPDDEMTRLLISWGDEQIMGGTAGFKGDNLGEVWINPETRAWVFIQRIPDAGIACMVLGGEQMTGKGRRT